MGDIKALLCGYYGHNNSGDEALLVSLLQMLPSDVKPIVLSGNPDQTSDRYSVESLHSRSLVSIIKKLSESHFFIWGGGSLIQDVTSWGSPYYYLGLMALAQQQGLKTMAIAQGIGPIKSSLTRYVTKQVLSRCQAVTVRDQASAQLLSDWQIPLVLAPDPVWALEPIFVKDLWELSAPRVAVCWRSHAQLTEERLDILTQALIDFQKATNTCILLIPFQPSQDLAIAEKVAAQLPGVHQILSLEDPRQLKGLFRGVEMTIGMRYHSLIMAAATGNRCFALSYDPKVTQLIQELNLPGWELSKLPKEANVISTAWLQEYINGESLNINQIQSLIDRALMHQEVLKNTIEE